jgi:hypothetical protein
VGWRVSEALEHEDLLAFDETLARKLYALDSRFPSSLPFAFDYDAPMRW